MDALGTYLGTEIVKALGEGNLVKVAAYIGIFLFLWIEVRGLKKEMVKLNLTIGKSFADGEARFGKIETNLSSHEYRITTLEQHSTPRGA